MVKTTPRRQGYQGVATPRCTGYRESRISGILDIRCQEYPVSQIPKILDLPGIPGSWESPVSGILGIHISLVSLGVIF